MLLVFLALLAAMFMRFGNDAELVLWYQSGFLKIGVVCLVCTAALYYWDLYDSVIISNPREVLTRLVQVLGVVSLALAFLYYIYPPMQLGRGILLIAITLLGIVLVASREMFFAFNRSTLFAERAILLGDGALAQSLAAEVKNRPELGIRILGAVSSGRSSDGNGLQRLGRVDELPGIIEANQVKRIIVAMGDRRGTMPVRELLDLRLNGVLIEDGTRLMERVSGKLDVDSMYPSWLIFSDGFRLNRGVLVMQRLIGIFGSLVVLCVALPLLPIIILAIKLSSRGPVLYRQQRVGQDGRIFYCYKFRTMRADAEADTGPTWASDNDPRITRVGRFLRTTRLDEIPQLWNVLRGDMAFVGPRPERPEFDKWLKSEIPYYGVRHVVLPGLTGWAQINYGYGSSVEQAHEKMKYDLYYIKNMSISLDLLIIFQTIKTVLFGKGAR
jgi:sugar transferase (PEP-CTERM system associated)